MGTVPAIMALIGTFCHFGVPKPEQGFVFVDMGWCEGTTKHHLFWCKSGFIQTRNGHPFQRRNGICTVGFTGCFCVCETIIKVNYISVFKWTNKIYVNIYISCKTKSYCYRHKAFPVVGPPIPPSSNPLGGDKPGTPLGLSIEAHFNSRIKFHLFNNIKTMVFIPDAPKMGQHFSKYQNFPVVLRGPRTIIRMKDVSCCGSLLWFNW